MHWACYKGFADTARLLLVMGARAGLPDREGCTPLHWAAIRGNSEACTVLLQVGTSSSRPSRESSHRPPAVPRRPCVECRRC